MQNESVYNDAELIGKELRQECKNEAHKFTPK